jgi:acetyl esterase/lipase
MLKYRNVEYGHPAPLRDVLRAVRIVRSRASEFGIDAKHVGVLGGSAGAHLAACAGTLFDAPEGKTGAPLDAVSARPDFMVLIFPVITMREPYVHMASRRALLGDNPSEALIEHLSVELQVTKETPPAFIVHSQQDHTVPVDNSILFYTALCHAGVPGELHLYAKGPHGSGMDPRLGPTAEWPKRCETWLRFNGWLPAASN